ncbi:hypothetical protein [Burkholderia sp. ABCPW 111]|uniref:hypothetical protein n=1 Tax=Burkholderia sp. ABCPW 111 TaxID=1820025 RepID=UPI001378254B|nr:hypothetical protein [Burkholderia sp. ABCPW 111]
MAGAAIAPRAPTSDAGDGDAARIAYRVSRIRGFADSRVAAGLPHVAPDIVRRAISLSADPVAAMLKWPGRTAANAELRSATGEMCRAEGFVASAEQCDGKSALRPATCDLRPATCDLRPATLNPRPATHDPRSATRDPQPATRNPQPATRNPQPATHDAGDPRRPRIRSGRSSPLAE